MITKFRGKIIQIFSIENDEDIFIKCLTWYWTSSIANSVLKRILGSNDMTTLISAIVTMPVFFLFLMYSFCILGKQKRLAKFLCPEMFLSCLFFLSYLRGTPYKPMILLIIWLTLSLFLGTIMVSIIDYERLYLEFEKLIPIYVLFAISALVIKQEPGEYMMHFSFLLALPMCQCIYSVIEENRLLYLVPLFIFLGVVLLKGSRGVIGCVIAFIFLCIVLKCKKLFPKIIIILGTVGGCVFFELIVDKLYYFLEAHGISSRTIWLLKNDLMHDSGRGQLYLAAQELINQHPWWGWGVVGERVSMDVYPHNIVYEFMIDFGIPIGCVLLIFVCIILFCGFIRSDSRYAILYIIFVSSCVSLLWSGSYLSTPEFWISIYMAIHVCKNNLRVEKEEQ